MLLDNQKGYFDIRESYAVLKKLDVTIKPSMLRFWHVLPQLLLVETLGV